MLERIMIAYDYDGEPRLLVARGWEVEARLQCVYTEDLEFPEAIPDPRRGIWVITYDTEGEMDVSLRRPYQEEWDYLQEAEYKSIFDFWGDITSRDQVLAVLKGQGVPSNIPPILPEPTKDDHDHNRHEEEKNLYDQGTPPQETIL